MQVTAPENLRDAAYEYCCSAYAKGTSFFTIANKLTKLACVERGGAQVEGGREG